MSVNSFEDYPMSWKPQRPSSTPLYLSIAQLLETDIRAGILPPGTKLPPQRELADFLEVNISTIVRAFKLCTQKGLLSATVGNGTYVSYDACANLKMLPLEKTAPYLEMGPLMPCELEYGEVRSILQEMFYKNDITNLFGYANTESTAWRLDAAAQVITRAGLPVSADKLLLANGGQNAITTILCGLFAPGDRIGTDPLTYPGLKSAAKMLGIQLIPIQQQEGEMSEEGIDYAFKNERIKGIYTMPDYQNPTTQIMSIECRKRIARTAKAKGLVIIEDKIHGLFSDNYPKPIAFYAPEQTIYIASLSKTVLPGLRLAYMIAPKAYRPALENALYSINLTVSPFLFELGSRLMASGKAYKIAQAHERITVQRNQIVDDILRDYPIYGSPSCIFRWLLLPQGITSEAFEDLAIRSGVQVYGAHRFAVGNARPQAAVRLSVTTPKTTEDLRIALQILKNILDGV